MTPVAILPTVDPRGDKVYRAIAGNKQSVGKTAGQALDALTDQGSVQDTCKKLSLRIKVEV
ncbi:hypothetical protein [Candidatus Contendibacter odensensis]|uniref:Uncharacterized protein n=1 Tax=Candidatus Contendobacter odensis Run_B_J11 TaxID=1400861 RepID=A0A7U7J4Q9_9GAMM|nr:hypothetical protein [Candidatus Contendobacter odensis]CDH47545.1 hypothetical protein BN874_840008 [Candidatus Contendobacter odensis Run_B_J11]